MSFKDKNKENDNITRLEYLHNIDREWNENDFIPFSLFEYAKELLTQLDVQPDEIFTTTNREIEFVWNFNSKDGKTVSEQEVDDEFKKEVIKNGRNYYDVMDQFQLIYMTVSFDNEITLKLFVKDKNSEESVIDTVVSDIEIVNKVLPALFDGMANKLSWSTISATVKTITI